MTSRRFVNDIRPTEALVLVQYVLDTPYKKEFIRQPLIILAYLLFNTHTVQNRWLVKKGCNVARFRPASSFVLLAPATHASSIQCMHHMQYCTYCWYCLYSTCLLVANDALAKIVGGIDSSSHAHSMLTTAVRIRSRSSSCQDGLQK